MARPWFDSNDIIASVKRKIAVPLSQNTFEPEDILAFANEEMAISQVPSVLSFHEEYFVTSYTIPIIANVSRYPIPTRAIGMRLRSIFWKDSSNNLFDLTRVNSDDKAFFQANVGANQAIHKFYMEGNDINLVPSVGPMPTGYLVFFYFIRPNQLVTTDRVATIISFKQDVVIDESQLAAGDYINIGSATVPGNSFQNEIPYQNSAFPTAVTTPVLPNGVNFIATTGVPGPREFLLVSGDSVATATNLVNAINTEGTFSATNGIVPTTTVSITSTSVLPNFIVTNILGFITSSNVSINCESTDSDGVTADVLPANIITEDPVDFLQTLPGHRIRAWSIPVPNGGVSGNSVTFPLTSVPTDLVVGDYLASENECIIPMIPDDLHSGLAERTAGRILAAMGDQAGLAMTSAKIQEINQSQGTLLDNRVEGNPQKVLARHSLLRYGKMGVTRRL